jgi:hypothetical protein
MALHARDLRLGGARKGLSRISSQHCYTHRPMPVHPARRQKQSVQLDLQSQCYTHRPCRYIRLGGRIWKAVYTYKPIVYVIDCQGWLIVARLSPQMTGDVWRMRLKDWMTVRLCLCSLLFPAFITGRLRPMAANKPNA